MSKNKKLVMVSILAAIAITALLFIFSEINEKSGIFVNPNYNTVVNVQHPLDGETYIDYNDFYLRAFVGTDAPNNDVYFNLVNEDTGYGWAWNMGSTYSSGKTITLSNNNFKSKYLPDTNYSWYITIWSNDILIWSNRNSKWHFDTYTSNTPPVADAGGPYTGVVGHNINFDGTGSYDPDGTIVAWKWDLNGDGVYEYHYDKFSRPMPFNTAGTYVITLRVEDDKGAFDIDTTTVTLTQANLPPVADAGGSRDSDGTIASFLWDVDGDGKFDLSGEYISVKYTQAGNYTVTLKVTDDYGSSSTDTTYAYISGVSPPEPQPPTPEDEDSNRTTFMISAMIIGALIIGVGMVVMKKKNKV